MIERIIIKGYKCIQYANIVFNAHKNVIVGNNGVGKSTLMEALSLALGYGLGKFEVTPHIFNIKSIEEYKRTKILPEILIEVYLGGTRGDLSGTNNSLGQFANGLYLRIRFDEIFAEIYETECKDNTYWNIPCEYYKIERMWFSQQPVVQYKMPFLIQIVDTSSLYFSSSSNQYIYKLIETSLSERDSIAIRTSLRHLKEDFDRSKDVCDVNSKIAERKKGLSLSVDVISNMDKRGILHPFIDDIPVSQIGSGDICQLKTLLALSNDKENPRKKVIIIEEPESHLSHTKMYEMLQNITDNIVGQESQIFITTHNSFVANKLDLSNLIMLENYDYQLKAIRLRGDEYVYDFFKKVSHYPTLRMILSKSVILVEGPTDEMVLTYFYYKYRSGKHPFNDGIELISVGGTSFKAYVELLKCFQKKVAIITDNDKHPYEELLDVRGLSNLPDNIRLFADKDTALKTLEPSFVHINRDNLQELSDCLRMNRVKHDTEEGLVSYMENNKSDWSCRLLNNIDRTSFSIPSYIEDAVSWITNIDDDGE